MPYDRFLARDLELKQLCTEWQLRDGQPNDHADAAYDQAIRDRLGHFDDEVQPVLAGIATILPWSTRYRDRFAAARARFVSGDDSALTGVLCESYHDVWMELHEDLIITQGIDRATEGAS